MKLSVKKLIILLLYIFFLNLTRVSIFAQQSETDFGIAYPVEIQLQENQFLEDGMIISHTNGTYQLSVEAYDRNIIGAVNISPKIEFTETLDSNRTPVISSGVTRILVSGENGPILVGDTIAASNVPGIGMKATKSGFTLGIATEEFDGQSNQDQGLIKVRIRKDFTFAKDTPDSETIGNRLRDIVSLSAIAAIDDPQVVFKYVLAAIILISSILVSFISLSRTSQKGIEALGRNPLAKTSITTGIFVNIVVSIIILGSGLAGTYFVVTL